MAGRARMPLDKLQAKAGFTEAIEVVEEIKCTNAQLMDLASFREAVKLHTLDLSFNAFHILRNIEGILEAPALRHLSFTGSPVSKMPNYRAYVVARLPLLQTLDSKVVTLEERQHAQRLYPDLVTVPPVDNNFVTPISTAPPSPTPIAAPVTPAKPKITHTDLTALFSSDPAAITGTPVVTKSPSDFNSLFPFSSPAKPTSAAAPTAPAATGIAPAAASASLSPFSSDHFASTSSAPLSATFSRPPVPTTSPSVDDLFAPQMSKSGSSAKLSAADLAAAQKQKKVDALERFFSAPTPTTATPVVGDTMSKAPSPYPEAEDQDIEEEAFAARPGPAISDAKISSALADLATYYIGCPGKHYIVHFFFDDSNTTFAVRLGRRKPAVLEGKVEEADSCVTCQTEMGLLILRGQFDLSVAVLMGKAMASHPQAIVSFSSSFRFPLTLTPPPPLLSSVERFTESEIEPEIPAAASEKTNSTADSTATTEASASPSGTASSVSNSALSPSPSTSPSGQHLDCSAWFALSDEQKFALALEAFLSGWQGCAWAGDSRFEMLHASVPPVVISISPIDVQVVAESPTQKYMCNIKATLEWMLGLVSGQTSKDAAFPKEMTVVEGEAGDWKRFMAAFDFSKKAFAAAQASLKHREEDKSGLTQERDDVELCLALLVHSYWRVTRWTGCVRLRIELKSQGGQDVTRTVVLPVPKTANPKVILLPNWDSLQGTLLATLTLSSDAWFEMAQAKSTVLNMLFDRRIRTDNVAGLIKFANSFTFGEKRYAAFAAHYKAREAKLDYVETSQLLTAADEHSIGDWFAGLVKKGMDSSLYLYERVTQPSSAPAANTSSRPLSPPAALSPRGTNPSISAPILVPSPPAASPPAAAATPLVEDVNPAPAPAPAQPPTSALRDLDKCVDELLQIATEKQGHTEAEQALLIEKLKAYIDAQKKQGDL